MSHRVLPTVALVLGLSVPAFAADPAPIDAPATALRPAVPATPVATDVVSIYDSGALDSSTADGAFAAARDAGGTAAIGRAVSLGMVRLTREGAVVQQPPPGYAIPMGTTVLPVGAVARIMGRDVAAVLEPDTVVMGALTAGLRGAQAGDRIEVLTASGAVATLTVAAVVDDAVVGGTELLMSIEAADRLGITRLSRVLVWGFASREALDAALVRHGLISTSIRVRRSWDPPDPDSNLGMAQTKAALGEFAYRLNSNGSITVESAWREANITSGAVGTFPFRLNLVTGCHRTVRVALEAAMSELIAAGAADAINYGHANTAGGCYVARFTRSSATSSMGWLSRHTWGMAVDTNTIGSCMGCAPPDFATHPRGCEAVRIFRKHGFAWGGNWLTPDGMHFEWVGEPRDQLPYPSRYCPNVVSGVGQRPADPSGEPEVARATMFADDGLVTGHADE